MAQEARDDKEWPPRMEARRCTGRQSGCCGVDPATSQMRAPICCGVLSMLSRYYCRAILDRARMMLCFLLMVYLRFILHCCSCVILLQTPCCCLPTAVRTCDFILFSSYCLRPTPYLRLRPSYCQPPTLPMSYFLLPTCGSGFRLPRSCFRVSTTSFPMSTSLVLPPPVYSSVPLLRRGSLCL